MNWVYVNTTTCYIEGIFDICIGPWSQSLRILRDYWAMLEKGQDLPVRWLIVICIGLHWTQNATVMSGPGIHMISAKRVKCYLSTLSYLKRMNCHSNNSNNYALRGGGFTVVKHICQGLGRKQNFIQMICWRDFGEDHWHRYGKWRGSRNLG